MNIIRRLLLSLLLSIAFLACKPSDRSLEPIANSKKEISERDSGLDGQVDPASIVAQLINAPEGESRVTNLDIQVKGDGLSHYTFKIGPSLTTECGLAYDYILQPIEASIRINIDNIPDGDIHLCVVGQHNSGIWQPYERASFAKWNKQTGALGSPINLTAIPAAGRVSLVWERPEAAAGFLVVRSSTAIEWQPTIGESYEPGPTEEVEILISENVASLIDSNLTDRVSYYYAIYTYDVQYRYSPPAVIAAIPSAEAYAWVQVAAGAFLRDAVIGGTRFDNSRNLYICRVVHIDQNSVNYGQHTGKFVPVTPGDLTAGDCYYPFGNRTFRVTANFEILVITRGRFEDWLQWTPITFPAQFPTFTFVAGTQQQPSLDMHVCRFIVGNNGYYKPGKIAVGFEGCHVDALGSPNNLRIEASFQLLTVKSLSRVEEQ